MVLEEFGHGGSCIIRYHQVSSGNSTSRSLNAPLEAIEGQLMDNEGQLMDKFGQYSPSNLRRSSIVCTFML